MASLKRYKQPSENSANRLQDVPPRFKRQKSLTSPKQQNIMEPANQNAHPTQIKNKKATLGDSLPSSSTWSSLSHQKVSCPREGRKIVKKISPQKALLNIDKAASKSTMQPFVLSPMENKLFNLMRNDEGCENSAYPTMISQGQSSDQILGLSTKSAIDQQSIPSDQSAKNSNVHCMTPTPPVWFEENSTNSHCSSQRLQGHSPTPNINSYNSKNAEQPVKDYSDPDIRTIEMLRELERVADQTDVGNEENTNDKNSLVSHHLRMLMCAVDRYTQGVDENMGTDTDSLDEETVYQTDRRSLPSPLQMPNENLLQSCDDRKSGNKSYSSRFTNDDHFEKQTSHQYFPATENSYIHQPFYYADTRKLNTWNPWSTPSFNALDVYASPSDIHNSSSSNLNGSSMFHFDHNNAYYYARDACY